MKTLDQHTIASAVRSIAPGYGVVKAYLFGSHARGDADAASDVDLCIEPDDGFTLFSLGGFGSHLEEALGVPVDVSAGLHHWPNVYLSAVVVMGEGGFLHTPFTMSHRPVALW